MSGGGEPDDALNDWAITPPVFPEGRLFTRQATEEPDPPPNATLSGAPERAPSVLTVDELAALLRLNRKTVYEALARGEIPGARRIGSSYRILRDAVLEWLASSQGRVPRSRSHR